MRHQPGSEMVADIGTKALASVRLKELKGRLGLKEDEAEEAVCQEKRQEEGSSHKERLQVMESAQAEKLMKVLMVMALVQRAKGEDEEEEDPKVLECALLLYTILVVVGTVVSQLLWKRWRQGHHRPNPTEGCSATREDAEEEAPLPALQRRASAAVQQTNIASSSTTREVRGQQAGTIQPKPVSSATSQPSRPTPRGDVDHSEAQSEPVERIGTGTQARPDNGHTTFREEKQVCPPGNTNTNRHQQVSMAASITARRAQVKHHLEAVTMTQQGPPTEGARQLRYHQKAPDSQRRHRRLAPAFRLHPASPAVNQETLQVQKPRALQLSHIQVDG